MVTVTTTNTGSRDETFFGSAQLLVDDEGTEYETDTIAGIALEDSNSVIELIEPGDDLTSTLVYDVPVDAPIAYLELNDSSIDDGVRVTVTR